MGELQESKTKQKCVKIFAELRAMDDRCSEKRGVVEGENNGLHPGLSVLLMFDFPRTGCDTLLDFCCNLSVASKPNFGIRFLQSPFLLDRATGVSTWM
jgi:hypothetical protein